MTARADLTCSWAVTRRGEVQPCDLTAVAWSRDPSPEYADAHPFPVCARHAYATCALPLDEAEWWREQWEVTARDEPARARRIHAQRWRATVAGDPRVTLAIAMRLEVDPADLALVLDVAAAAVRWYESIGVQETARAALAEADAIERLTPGARALLRGLQTGPGRPSSGGVALGDGDGLERGEDG